MSSPTAYDIRCVSPETQRISLFPICPNCPVWGGKTVGPPCYNGGIQRERKKVKVKMTKSEMFEDFDSAISYFMDELGLSFEEAYEMASGEIYN